MKSKILNISLIILNFIFPFTLFFNCFLHQYQKVVDDKVVVVKNYYNIIGFYKNFNPYYIIMIIIMIISMFMVVAFAINGLIKDKHYSIILRICSSISIVTLISFSYFYTWYILICALIFISLNMFLISFDYRLNKKKKENMIIFIVTYVLFVISLVLSSGFIPTI